jgi:hypothetical protein
MAATFTPSRPKLRPLDVRHHTHDGQPYVLLRDPLQLSDRTLLVPQPLAAVLAFCDGARTTADLAAAYNRHYGFPVPPSAVDDLLRAMDEACLLDNARAQAAHARAVERYRSAPYRPPLLAGQSYPLHPDHLAEMLDDYLAAVDGEPLSGRPSRCGLLSPHIDYARGGAVYATVWQRAAQLVAQADLAILLGTDHYGSDPITLTRQHYATPYGVLPTAVETVDALAETIGEERAYAGELRHRGEHSLELVAVWLHHLRGGRPLPVVPILCGGFHPFFHNGAAPSSDDLYRGLLDTLRAAMAGRSAVVIASGDLAHVGPAFGGAPLTPAQRRTLAAADQALIERMAAGDAEGFFGEIKRVQDRNNVCGVSPIYLTLKLLGAVRGELTGYASCPADEQDTSAVTVAGVVFHTL